MIYIDISLYIYDITSLSCKCRKVVCICECRLCIMIVILYKYTKNVLLHDIFNEKCIRSPYNNFYNKSANKMNILYIVYVMFSFMRCCLCSNKSTNVWAIFIVIINRFINLKLLAYFRVPPIISTELVLYLWQTLCLSFKIKRLLIWMFNLYWWNLWRFGLVIRWFWFRVLLPKNHMRH